MLKGFLVGLNWNALWEQQDIHRAVVRMQERGTPIWQQKEPGKLFIQAAQGEARTLLATQGPCTLVGDISGPTSTCRMGLSPQTILEAYLQWGEHCVHHLDGDYAFCIWDASRHQLFAARSPIGLHPCVFVSHPHVLLCASTPKLLCSFVSPQLNQHWIAQWLVFGRDHWALTPFQDIHELLPGHMMCVKYGTSPQIQSFWSPPAFSSLHIQRPEEAVDHVRSLLIDAVKRRMPTSGPACFDVSGGLDSSTLYCIAASLQEQGVIHAEPLIGINVSSRRIPEESVAHYAQAISSRYPRVAIEYRNVDHFESFDLEDPTAQMMLTSTPTLLPLIFPTMRFHLWRFIQEQGTATAYITGDFGDSLFATSRSYLLQLWQEKQYLTWFHEVWRWQRRGVSWHIHARQLLHGGKVQRTPIHSAPWLTSKVVLDAWEQQQQDEAFFKRICPHPFTRRLYQAILCDHKSITSSHEAIVRAGIHVSEPYTDLRLISFLFACPPDIQLYDSQPKSLLRAAASNILPSEILKRQDKGAASRLFIPGFRTHHHHIRRLFSSIPDELAPFLTAAPLLSAVDQVIYGRCREQRSLYAVIALLYWFQHYRKEFGNE